MRLGSTTANSMGINSSLPFNVKHTSVAMNGKLPISEYLFGTLYRRQIMIYVAKCEECGTFIKYGTQILMHDWSVIGPCCFEEGDNWVSAGVDAFKKTERKFPY